MASKRFNDLDGVRITEPVTGVDEFDENMIHHLPAGQEGTIVHVHSNGAAYMVEFILGEVGEDGYIDHPRYCVLTLEPHQLEPAP